MLVHQRVSIVKLINTIDHPIASVAGEVLQLNGGCSWMDFQPAMFDLI